MEVLAGFIIGILFTVLYFKKPFVITLNMNHKQVVPDFAMPTMHDALSKADSAQVKEDEAYAQDMNSFIQEVNSIMLGGKPGGKE